MATSTTQQSSELYVGLNPSGSAEGADTASPAPLPPSRIWTYIQIAVCLFVMRVLYAYSKGLALLGLIVFGAYAAYRINDSSQQAIHEHERRQPILPTVMDRIDREREESEAMVAEAARMMLDINRRHLEEFLITHPQSTYEQWIGNLHPENVEADGKTIDRRFYVQDSDHRILWNEWIGEEREFVPAKSTKKGNPEVV